MNYFLERLTATTKRNEIPRRPTAGSVRTTGLLRDIKKSRHPDRQVVGNPIRLAQGDCAAAKY